MTNTEKTRHITASELAGNVGAVLDDLESGASFVITRRGEPVAVMRPAELAPPEGTLQIAEDRAAYAPHAGCGTTHPATPAMARLIGTPSMRGVLGVFLLDPSAVLHQREVARRAGVGLRSAQIALVRLGDLGLIGSERSGNRRYYRALRSGRFEELRALMAREFGVAEVIARHLKAAGEPVDWAFIYGSVASGEDKVGSDVDLLVVGDATDDDLVAPIADAQRELGRQIDLVSYRPEVFEERRAEGNHFVASVLALPRIDVIGGPRDT